MIKKKFTQFSTIEKKNLFLKSKKILSENGIEIKIAKNNFEASKLLIITPKKIGCAPYRNYLRRCSKEIFKKLNYKNNYYIISFNKLDKKISYLDIKESFEKLS